MKRLVAVLILLAALPPVAAASEGPALVRLSFDPVPGDYTFIVRVEGFRLQAYNASAPDEEGLGHLAFLLNGFPCIGECSGGRDHRTNETRFTYRHLALGDVLTAELRTNQDKSLDPPVTLNVTVQSTGARCVEMRGSTCSQWESLGPFLAVTSGVPNAGDYTMTVRTARFTLVEGADDDAVDSGLLRYSKNGVPCEAECSGDVPARTTSTTFQFKDVKVGDRLTAELVRPDGSSLAPRTQATVVVAQPAIRIVSSPAQEGEYTLRVNVTGFNLAAPGAEPNAGVGHIVYLVQRVGATDFVRVQATTNCPQATATASTSIKMCNLKEGDRISAELVDTDGKSLSPRVMAPPMEVLRLPGDPFVTPGVGPLLFVALLGLALLRRQ